MPDSLIIRRIRADEGDAYREIRLRALADAPFAFGTTLAQASARAPEWWDTRATELAASTTSALFVADAGARLEALLGVVMMSDAARAEFISMWVDPAARGRGLGRLLLDAAGAWATEHGAGAFDLWVTEGNEQAIGLYRAWGFSFSGESRPHPARPGLTELAMRREGH